MSKLYELVVFTASMETYAYPLMDQLDKGKLWTQILSRSHCTYKDGAYVKDLSKIGRDLSDVILLDNSSSSYSLQVDNGMPITNWYDSPTDSELLSYIDILTQLSKVPDVRPYLARINCFGVLNYNEAKKVVAEIDSKYSSGKRISNNL